MSWKVPNTNLRLKGKKGPPARGAAPKGLGGVEHEKQPLRFADANHLPFQGRQSILNANWYKPDATMNIASPWGSAEARFPRPFQDFGF